MRVCASIHMCVPVSMHVLMYMHSNGGQRPTLAADPQALSISLLREGLSLAWDPLASTARSGVVIMPLPLLF